MLIARKRKWKQGMKVEDERNITKKTLLMQVQGNKHFQEVIVPRCGTIFKILVVKDS